MCYVLFMKPPSAGGSEHLAKSSPTTIEQWWSVLVGGSWPQQMPMAQADMPL
jgi:hypothetical protein